VSVHPEKSPLASSGLLDYYFSLGAPLFDLSNQKDTPASLISQGTTFENNSDFPSTYQTTATYLFDSALDGGVCDVQHC